MRLEISSRVVGEVLVVNCSGRIVAGDEVQAMHDHLKCASLETPDVVLHLELVGFTDSSGMGILVRLMTHARSRGGDLKLCVVPERILQSLSLTSLNRVFEIYASEAEAIAASYRRRQSEQNETFHGLRTVLCFEESADVCAYLRELLRHAGYSVDVDSYGNGTLIEPRMYQLIRQPAPIDDRQFEIEFLAPGVAAFSFTFG